MFGSEIIEAAIGLLLIYFLFSALCSALNEWIVGHFLQWRAQTLEKAIGRMLADSEMAKKFFEQPLIKTLANDDHSKPSYLSPALFVDGLLALVRDQAGRSKTPADPTTLDELAKDPKKLLSALGSLDNKNLRPILQGLVGSAQDMAEARLKLEAWFNEGMDRATGWYQKNVRICMAGLAFGVAVIFNVDTFTITRELMNNSKLRATLVAAAEETVKAQTNAQESVQAIEARIKKLDLPIGWARQTNVVQLPDKTSARQVTWPGSEAGWGMRLGGWLITAGALSLGAPFWFDLLGKIINLRAAGKKPQAPKEAKQE